MLLVKKSIIPVLLACAFLASSGMALGSPQEPVACCEKEAGKEAAPGPGCSGPDCICLSCISIASVRSFHMDNASLTGAAGFNRSQPVLRSGYFRSIDRPPKSC